jgi:branched-subunit amino acid aminotransferase/4-amino-4-deoxychorismate lyase
VKTPISLLETNDAIAALREKNKASYQANYFAMYSSWLGGITTDPALMIVPVDDHIVHRGDGIFEAIKVAYAKPYALDAHLDRLERSLSAVGMAMPESRFDLTTLINECVRVAFKTPQGQAAKGEALIRLFVSRGPGGFTTNPYESIGSQLYIIVTALKSPSAEAYKKGVKAIRSRVAVKEAPFATIKSCNYLPNVMMKKEAVDNEVDFTLSFDRDGFLGEGSTENCAIVSARGEFIAPTFTNTLKGITLSRALELALPLIELGQITQIRQAALTLVDLHAAREIILLGTTMDVLAITEFEGKPVGSGAPGPVFQSLLRLLRADQER